MPSCKQHRLIQTCFWVDDHACPLEHLNELPESWEAEDRGQWKNSCVEVFYRTSDRFILLQYGSGDSHEYRVIDKSEGYLGGSEPFKNFVGVAEVVVDEIGLSLVALKDFLHSPASCLVESGRDTALLELLLDKILHVGSQPFFPLDAAVEQMRLHTLSPHPQHQINPQFFHRVQKLKGSVPGQCWAESNLFSKFPVDFPVEHGLEGLFVGTLVLFKDLPGLRDDLSGVVAAADVLDEFSHHLFHRCHQLLHHVVVLGCLGGELFFEGAMGLGLAVEGALLIGQGGEGMMGWLLGESDFLQSLRLVEGGGGKVGEEVAVGELKHRAYQGNDYSSFAHQVRFHISGPDKY